MVQSYAGVNPVGPRIMRGDTLPTWDFTNLTEEQAKTGALALQKYVDSQ